MYSGCEPQELFVVIYIWFLFLAACLGGDLLGIILLVGIILYTYMGGGGDIAPSLSGQLAWYVRNCMPVDRNSSSSFFYNSPRLWATMSLLQIAMHIGEPQCPSCRLRCILIGSASFLSTCIALSIAAIVAFWRWLWATRTRLRMTSLRISYSPSR